MPTFVQAHEDVVTATTTGTSPAFTAIGSHNTIIGWINGVVGTTNLTSVTDNAAGSPNVYTLVSGITWGGIFWVGFYCAGVQGSPTTLTFNFAATEGGATLLFHFSEYSQVGGVLQPLLTPFNSMGTTAGVTLSTVDTNSTFWGVLNCSSAGTVTVNSPFTIEDNNGGTFNRTVADAAFATPSTNTLTFTNTDATSTYMIMAAELSPFGALAGTLTGNAISITNPFDATGSVVCSVGDLIYGVVGEQTSLTSSGCTDNLGNTYAATNAGTDSGTSTGRAWYAIVTAAGTLTAVHFAATASADNVAVFAVVIKGPFAATNALAIDANPANAQDITSPFSCPATGTLQQSKEVVIGWAVATGSPTWAATSPFLLAGQATTATILHTNIGYKRVFATTTTTPNFTGTAPTDDVLGTNSFMPAFFFAGGFLTPESFPVRRRFRPALTPPEVNRPPAAVTPTGFEWGWEPQFPVRRRFRTFQSNDEQWPFTATPNPLNWQGIDPPPQFPIRRRFRTFQSMDERWPFTVAATPQGWQGVDERPQFPIRRRFQVDLNTFHQLIPVAPQTGPGPIGGGPIGTGPIGGTGPDPGSGTSTPTDLDWAWDPQFPVRRRFRPQRFADEQWPFTAVPTSGPMGWEWRPEFARRRFRSQRFADEQWPFTAVPTPSQFGWDNPEKLPQRVRFRPNRSADEQWPFTETPTPGPLGWQGQDLFPPDRRFLPSSKQDDTFAPFTPTPGQVGWEWKPEFARLRFRPSRSSDEQWPFTVTSTPASLEWQVQDPLPVRRRAQLVAPTLDVVLPPSAVAQTPTGFEWAWDPQFPQRLRFRPLRNADEQWPFTATVTPSQFGWDNPERFPLRQRFRTFQQADEQWPFTEVGTPGPFGWNLDPQFAVRRRFRTFQSADEQWPITSVPTPTAFGFDWNPQFPFRIRYRPLTLNDEQWSFTATPTPTQFGWQIDPQVPVRGRFRPQLAQFDVIVSTPAAITPTNIDFTYPPEFLPVRTRIHPLNYETFNPTIPPPTGPTFQTMVSSATKIKNQFGGTFITVRLQGTGAFVFTPTAAPVILGEALPFGSAHVVVTSGSAPISVALAASDDGVNFVQVGPAVTNFPTMINVTALPLLSTVPYVYHAWIVTGGDATTLLTITEIFTGWRG